MENSSIPENRVRNLLRVVRPLFWWFLLVLVLFGIRTHQRLLEKTRIYFDVTMQGKEERFSQALLDAGDTPFGATASIDGYQILTGQKIPLGNHTFRITHPKTDPFVTNLFIWYGAHNLGTIDLKRAHGTLAVTVQPPAPLLSIRGLEYSVTLTNSSGINTLVPTDEYRVTAQYAHSEETKAATVFADITTPVRIAPNFGVLDLTCNQNGVTFQLNVLNGWPVQTGELPALIKDLPHEVYEVVAWHHNHQWTKQIAVIAGMTNTYHIEFQYGTAVLNTTPSGATVVNSDGRDLGTTPLTLNELQPGTWKFNLQLFNYEPVTVSLDISANGTETFQTNLVSLTYTGAMRAAREFMNAGKYDQAIESLNDALRVQPGDAAAAGLEKEAVRLAGIAHAEAAGLAGIVRAEALGKQGDYIGGIKELDKVLATLPENQKAKQLLADFKQHETEQIEQTRVERLNQGKKVLDTVIAARYSDGDVFETHELKSSKALKDIELPLIAALKGEPTKLTITKYNDSSEVFVIEAEHDFSTALATSAGRRQCVIVGAQTKEDETQILFKVLEYKVEAKEKFSIGNLIGAPAGVNYLPIRATGETEKLQARVAEGISNVTAVIQGVIGTPTTSPAP